MAELEEVTVQYLSEEREPDGSRSQAQAEASSSGSWLLSAEFVVKSGSKRLGPTTYAYFMYNFTFHTYLLLLAYMPPSHAYLRTSVSNIPLRPEMLSGFSGHSKTPMAGLSLKFLPATHALYRLAFFDVPNAGNEIGEAMYARHVLYRISTAMRHKESGYLCCTTTLMMTKSLLSALLVRRGKFIARAGSDVCPVGYRKNFTHQVLRNTDRAPVQCTNYPNTCAPIGYYCCNDLYSCPNDNFCFGSDECCPNTAQTCNGNACCSSGSQCCNNNSCCNSGTFCCNDSFGGCCPNGSTCIANTNTCSSGGSGGGSSVTTTTTTTPSKSTVGTTFTSSSVITFNSPTITFDSPTITFNSPTTNASSSTHFFTSSTVSSGGFSTTSLSLTSTTSLSIPSTGAALRGIALVPGKQLVAMAAVISEFKDYERLR
ncbi:hypothetical protein EDB19DRAFT_2024816 [Suillus lakei]|nr:hypothetical protein EDB19DRAFT_2024816 [Suillus lakei]